MNFVLIASLITAFALFILYLIVSPSFAASSRSQTDARKLDLEEERELLLEQIAELEASKTNISSNISSAELAELERAILRLKVSLAGTLERLDALPPTPATGKPLNKIGGLALGIALGITAVVVLGSFSFLSSWQKSALSANAAKQLEISATLPNLKSQAEAGKFEDLLNYADANFDLERYGIASEFYGKALKLNPGHPKALRRFGFLLSQSDGKYRKQGTEFLVKSNQLDPKDIEGYVFLAAVQVQDGSKDVAIQTLERASTIDPKNATVRQLLAQINPSSALGGSDVGQNLYTQNCASCHGAQGQGISAPGLQKSALLGDANALKSIIRNGRGGMQGYPTIQGQDLERLVGFVQGLRK